jgi:hypothetical protein
MTLLVICTAAGNCIDVKMMGVSRPDKARAFGILGCILGFLLRCLICAVFLAQFFDGRQFMRLWQVAEGSTAQNLCARSIQASNGQCTIPNRLRALSALCLFVYGRFARSQVSSAGLHVVEYTLD